MLVQAKDLEFSYNINQIFKDVSFVINEGDKIGMVGDNGSGKSTLAKCIAGLLTPTGQIFYNPDIKISYLKQQISTDEVRSVFEVALSKYDNIIQMEKDMRQLENDMADAANDSDRLNVIMNEYQIIQDEFDKLNGYAYLSEIKGYLAMVGMNEDFYDRTVMSLSGGEKARLELALIFMEKADLLILDEPTNHMDVDMINYLERMLIDFRGSVLFISHDRLLLQNVANKIFDVENGGLSVYDMGYDKYRNIKRARIEEQQRHYESFKEEEARLKEIIRRYRSFAREKSYKQAKSREKMLERMKAETPPPKSQEIKFKFPESTRTGRDVLTVLDLKKSFEDKILFQNVNFEVKLEDRLSIIGPNGCGKTTLFNILRGNSDFDGEYLWGAGVKLGYFNQELKVLDEENTLIDEISDEYPKLNIYEIRTLLGNFLFSGEDAFKVMKDLSGGERARISLLKLILSGANVLLLDEPTNHLDLTSKEILEEALLAFKGTIIFVSHDRFFIKRIANKIYDMAPSERKMYIGDYDYYLSKKEEQNRPVYVEVNKTEIAKEKKKTREEIRKSQAQRRKIEALEDEITTLEDRISKIEEIMLESSTYDDHEYVLELNKEHLELRDKIDSLMEEWEKLSTLG